MTINLAYDASLARVRITLDAINPNPYFETNTTGWAASGCTLARSTAQAHQGSASLLMTPTGAATAQAAFTASGSPAVTPGRQYTFTAWVYSPNGYGAVTADIDWLNASNQNISTTLGATTAIPAGTWTKLTTTATAPAQAARAAARVTIRNNPTATDVLYVDEARFVPAPGSVVVERSTNGITWSQVRGSMNVDLTSGPATLDDYEFPPGVPVTYRFHGDTAQITVGLDGVWIKNIAKPWLNRQVKVVEASAIERPSRGGVFDVVGRTNPVTVTDVRASRRFDLVVLADTGQEADDLELALSAGDVVFLHVPPGCPLPIDTMYAAVGDLESEQVSRYSEVRLLTLPLTETAAPSADVVGSTITWSGVLNAYSAWQALLDVQPTWADVLEQIGKPGDIVVP